MSQFQALIVDDEPDILELLELTLKKMGLHCHAAQNITQAIDLLHKEKIDLCFTDMKLPDGTGLELVKHIQNLDPQIPVAVITAYGSMQTAIDALKHGAFDFVSKPLQLDTLRNLVNTALKLKKSTGEISNDIKEVLLGESPEIQHIHKMVSKLARSQAPVFIQGESGTGKELVARQIHMQSPRNDQPFIAVNCGAIPTELMESELFGHRKGSFTGAESNKEGLFMAANGGTLFLDEIAELPTHMQVKLLRAIQERAIRPIGEQKEHNIDVRILSATNKDIRNLVKSGGFREDLYYRLNVIELKLPPLRARGQDIKLLAIRILEKIDPSSRLSKGALDALLDYPFPGNIRELENLLHRAVALSENNTIEAADLYLKDSHLDMNTRPMDSKSARQSDESLEQYMERIEAEEIASALDQNHWNRTAAAKQLGMSLRKLRYRMSKLDITE
jgi:two-component system response regulator PilR (NtrC family)